MRGILYTHLCKYNKLFLPEGAAHSEWRNADLTILW